MKAITNTTIRLGLLNLPVGVCKATGELADVKFNLGDAQGRKLTQQYVDPDGKIIPTEDRTKTIDGHIIDTEALAAIEAATKLPDLSILKIESRERFVQEAHRINGFYFLQNNAKVGNINAYKLFVDALAELNSVAVTKVTFRSRQALMVIFPQDGVLAAVTMAFGPDVRVPDQGVRAHIAGQYSDAEMDMAKQLLTVLSDASADPLSSETDAAVAKRHELVAQAMQGVKIEVPKAPEPAVSDALGDALKASLAALAQPVEA